MMYVLALALKAENADPQIIVFQLEKNCQQESLEMHGKLWLWSF